MPGRDIPRYLDDQKHYWRTGVPMDCGLIDSSQGSGPQQWQHRAHGEAVKIVAPTAVRDIATEHPPEPVQRTT